MFAVYVVQLRRAVSDRPKLAGSLTISASTPMSSSIRCILFQLLTYGFLHGPVEIQHISSICWGCGSSVATSSTATVAASIWHFFCVADRGGWPCLGAGRIRRQSRICCRARNARRFRRRIRRSYSIRAEFPASHDAVHVLPADADVGRCDLLIVGYDAYGAVQRTDPVAFTAHLGGALFALIYYQAGWRLERILAERIASRRDCGRSPSSASSIPMPPILQPKTASTKS